MPGHSQRAAYALQKLAEDDPALAALALWCRHRDADAGAAAAWTTGETIHYGPGFDGLAPHEQVGLAAHHVLHVAFRHGARSEVMRLRFGERFSAEVYNIAADAITNETLLLAGYALPRPSVALTPLLRDLRTAPEIAKDALARLDADALYVMLLHDRGSQSRDRAGEDDASARAAQVRDKAEEMGFASDLAPDPADPAEDPNAPEDAGWRQRIAVAMEQGRQAGRGIGALGFRIADLPEPKTPWETVLRRLVTKALMHERHPDHRRPARRWLAQDAAALQAGTDQPAYQPAMRQDNAQPRIVVGLDSSGSVDTDRLAIFATQVAAIARRTLAEVHLLVFDETVQSRSVLRGAEVVRTIEQVVFSRDGGTAFDDVITRAMALDPSIIVILTDLDGPFGTDRPACPVLWAVPSGTERPAPFGRVLSLAE